MDNMNLVKKERKNILRRADCVKFSWLEGACVIKELKEVYRDGSREWTKKVDERRTREVNRVYIIYSHKSFYLFILRFFNKRSLT